jgi:SAM-dependent methyltransferase
MSFARLERDAWADPGVAEAYSRLWREFVAPSVPRLLDAALVGPGDRLLDVATGPGPVVRDALLRNARPTALDFSRPMLEKGAAGVPKLQADAGHLPLRDATFDRVVSNLGLLHFPDPDSAIREAARVVRPGGVVAFAVWGADATALRIVPSALTSLGLVSPEPSAPGFFRFGEPGIFESAMRSAGLVPMPTEAVGWTGIVPDPVSFWSMFQDGTARTRASIRALGESDRLRLRDEVVRRVQEFRTPEGFAIPTSVVIGRGRRPPGPS